MGIFSDNVRRYHEFGIVTIPCKDKRPILGKDWQQFCDVAPSSETIDKWETDFKGANQLGLTLGKATLLSGFDFDYEYNEKKCGISEKEFLRDRKNIERQILAILPPTPCIKTGRKGWTRIYRSHGNLENAQTDRNGVRLFDFLARNKQTIIPPSRYSDDADFSYRWMGPPIEDCIDDIPFITMEHIDEVRFLLGEKIEDNSRHMKVFKWIIRQSVIEKDITAIARKAVEFDKLTNEVPYLSDKKHQPRDDAYLNALDFVKRIVKWKDSKSKSGAEPEILKAMKSSREIYFQYFEQNLGVHKRDLLSNKLMRFSEVKTAYGTFVKRWSPVLNELSQLRSDVLEVGLKREMVEDHLNKYRDCMKPSFVMDIPEWDGVDRLDKICRLVPAVNIVPYSSSSTDYEAAHGIYVDIVKDIAAGIFRRAFDSMEQNLFTIIRGPQGIGKNYFIDKLYCQPFSYYAAEVNVGPDMAKNYDAVDGRLVCVIGEFDQTQKVQISFIKELITNASFTARRAYERSSDRYELKQTFFSASNFDNVLKDSSGNRRFVIFDIPYFNYEYNEWCDSGQLLAQYFTLYKQGHRMSAASKAWIDTFNRDETPEDPIELAFESYLVKMKIKFTLLAGEWLSNEQVSEIISEVCKINGVPAIRFRQVLRRRKYAKKVSVMKYLNPSHVSEELDAAWRKKW